MSIVQCQRCGGICIVAIHIKNKDEFICDDCKPQTQADSTESVS